MRIIADLHVHSRHSRATSKNLGIDNLEKYAKIKGVDLLGTGDFQHPEYRKEIDEKLTEDSKGILRTKDGFPFIWQTEISLMYTQGGKGRAVHVVILAPNKEAADKITNYLKTKGRIDYDGRPIFGLSAKQAVKDLKAINEKIEIIPAHCLLPDEKIICNPEIKPISKICIGDSVLTHTGTYKKVTETFTRYYEGSAYAIQPYYFREGIKVTKEHPFLAIKTVKDCSFIGGLCKPNSIAKEGRKCTKKHYEAYEPKWILAKNLEINDILLYPRQKKIEDKEYIKISDFIDKSKYRISRESIVPKTGRQDKQISNSINITADLCRLIGYYLAEGYIIKKNNAVQFSFGKHETLYMDDVISLMKKVFGINIAKKRERNGYELYFYSKPVMELLEKLCYAEKKPLKAAYKRFPEWMLFLPLDKQAELFRGWWRGDAGVTVSEQMATQMKSICLRLGIIPSIYKKTKEEYNRKKQKFQNREITANHDCFILQNLSFFEDKFKLREDPAFRKFKTKLERKHGWLDENYVYIPIKKIEMFDYKGEVFNLEVEEDNSYVTSAATVHNCMTPWFGLYGSKKGFDSLKECFEEEVKHIYAVESGMSADPAMLWRFKENANIVSFSDLHSFWPWRIGREATIFEIEELSYDNIIKAIRTGNGLKGTIETYPEYGRYHWDGHRNCKFSCDFKETKKLNGICPKCKKPLIIGVEYRVEEIAKEKQGYKPNNAREYYELVPLHELIAAAKDTRLLAGKSIWSMYNALIESFGTEFNILLNVAKEKLLERMPKESKLITLIMLNRQGKLQIKPGFDGEYGVIIADMNSKLVL